jgi:hypothetical protein
VLVSTEINQHLSIDPLRAFTGSFEGSVIVSVLDVRFELLVLGLSFLALDVALLQSMFEVAELDCIVFLSCD